MQTLSDTTWQQFIFGDMQSHGALAVLPIMAELPTGPDYLTLGEALAAGNVSITEISEGGSVPELAVVNDGRSSGAAARRRRVGRRQAEPRGEYHHPAERASKTVIPVSCVEQGRWHYASREFQDSGNVMAANLRARKGRAVSENLASSGRRASDQGEVWAGVAEMACCFQVTSDTGAMRDVYAQVEHDLSALLHAFMPMPGQRESRPSSVGALPASSISRIRAPLPRSSKNCCAVMRWMRSASASRGQDGH